MVEALLHTTQRPAAITQSTWSLGGWQRDWWVLVALSRGYTLSAPNPTQPCPAATPSALLTPPALSRGYNPQPSYPHPALSRGYTLSPPNPTQPCPAATPSALLTPPSPVPLLTNPSDPPNTPTQPCPAAYKKRPSALITPHPALCPRRTTLSPS
ncbi:unnamed protein product [Boreogadus saida]